MRLHRGVPSGSVAGTATPGECRFRTNDAHHGGPAPDFWVAMGTNQGPWLVPSVDAWPWRHDGRPGFQGRLFALIRVGQIWFMDSGELAASRLEQPEGGDVVDV